MALKIIGVPEHFNFPVVQLAKENPAYAFSPIPEGTGKMLDMLEQGKTDIAITLTEGSLHQLSKNAELKLVHVYVSSPLILGIHVAHSSSFTRETDLEKATVAISRFNSGSHRMAGVWANKMGWNADQFTWNVIDTLIGAQTALPKGEADVFLWEKFTTQPLVDQNVFRRIGEIATPWPCFVLMTTQTVWKQKQEQIIQWMHELKHQCDTLKKNPTTTIAAIAQAYELSENMVAEWFAQLSWFGEVDWKKVENALKEYNLLPSSYDLLPHVKPI